MTNTVQIIIAVLLAYIAWENYRINHSGLHLQKDKLRLDLFERRMKVFGACQELFSFIAREGELGHDEVYKFIENTANAEFLFGKEIRAYIDEVREKSLRLISIKEQLSKKSRTAAEKIQSNLLSEESRELTMWFGNQFDVSRKHFRNYLQFTIYKIAK